MTAGWIFGYGSLVWRPAFPFEARVPGYVVGWTRRFWQGSTDHRGVVGAPGRVVTMIARPKAQAWGTLYRVGADHASEVLAGLDWREKGGYARHHVAVHVPSEGRVQLEVLMYLATPDNPNYLGDAPLEEIAAQVREAVGPSGTNLEYVLRLADALSEIGAADEHVQALATLLRAPD